MKRIILVVPVSLLVDDKFQPDIDRNDAVRVVEFILKCILGPQLRIKSLWGLWDGDWS
jgi:hypothetical protein